MQWILVKDTYLCKVLTTLLVMTIMTNDTILSRLASLREVMRCEKLDAFVFPSTDPHHSEYTPDRWKGREWISGFNGSAGTAVVTMDDAALWTDSRYFLAAEQQLEGTSFQLMRLKIKGTPSIAQWLGEKLKDGNAQVGVDGMCNNVSSVKDLVRDLRRQGGITVRTNFDPLNEIWKDRPSIPENKIEVHPMKYAGETTLSKIGRVRTALRDKGADGMLVSALDDIAWVLNLRGSDVHCNPVFVAYLLLSSHEATLFVDKVKLTPEVEDYLESQDVKVEAYEKVGEALRKYFEYNILLDPEETSYTLYNIIASADSKAYAKEIVASASPIPAMKAVKNDAEIAGYRNAMLRDGVAMVKFLKWLKPAVEAGGQTEISIDRQLTAFRAEQPLFRGISFDTIAGYNAHGAIVHYEATADTDIPLEPNGLLLLDSGAQYEDGTTDITRTIALGPVTDEMRRVYTLVLKGHIQLELAKFPDEASGTQLDALAREAMWREGMNFLHGTGHGVGSYLNVHEGPHQIRMEYMPAPLKAGMTVTDEPGLYLEGKFGVRHENTLLIQPYMSTAFGDFLQMESLTLCPFDTVPIIKEMLLPEEVDWLNQYHRHVFDVLAPHLDEEERSWLENATKEI